MKKHFKKIFFTFILFIAFVHVFSQENKTKKSEQQIQTVIVKMRDGQEYKGIITKEDAKTIILKTVNGNLNLKVSQVISVEKDLYKGKFKFANPHITRYFFGPSGFPIKKGKGYYQNILVTTNFINYGVTDNISLGGGFEFVSTLMGEPTWFLTPKVAFDVSENIHVGGGFIMLGHTSESIASLGYGVFTVGHPETNLSIGIGYGLIDGELAKHPAIMLSGTHRVSKSIALLSENYFVTEAEGDSHYFGIQGIRVISRKNSFDIGAIVIPEISEYIPALPYVGYVRVF